MKTLRNILIGGAMLVAVSGVASAATVVSTCGAFNVVSSGTTATWVCPSAASITPVGATSVTEEILYSSDYSNGIVVPVTDTTVFTFSAGSLTTDTVTSTGSGSSNGPTDSAGATVVPAVTATGVFGGFADILTNPSSTVTVTYSNTLVGSVLAATGYAQLVVNYTPATTTAPEPSTMALMGGICLMAGLVGKKRRNSIKA